MSEKESIAKIQRETLRALLSQKSVKQAAKHLAIERGWHWNADGEQGSMDRAQCLEEARSAIAGAVEYLVKSLELAPEEAQKDN